MWPRNFTESCENLHFSLSVTPVSFIFCRTSFSRSSCQRWLQVFLGGCMSSLGEKTLVLAIPNGRSLSQYRLIGVMKVVSYWRSGWSGIWWIPLLQSSLVNNVAPSSWASSWSVVSSGKFSRRTLSLSFVKTMEYRGCLHWENDFLFLQILQFFLNFFFHG